MIGRLWWVVALAVATGGAALAENPRIALKVEDVTLPQAAAALSQAAGIRVEFYTAELAAAERPALPAALAAKSSFDWSDGSFARALRQLCEKYNLRPSQRPGGGYTLYPAGAAGAAPPAPVGLFEKDGARLFARGVSVNESRSVAFTEGGQDWTNASLSLQLGCQLVDGDGETIAGVRNLTAKDDLGNLIVADERRTYRDGSGQYPDEWTGTASLTIPHPKAKRLVWVEGDLMVYKHLRPVRVELPLPAAGKSVRREVDDVILVVSGYEPTPREEEGGNLEGFPAAPGAGAEPEEEFSLRVRLFAPDDASVRPRGGANDFWSARPVVLGESGRGYSPQNINPSSWSAAGGRVIDMRCSFRMAEKPVRVLFDLAEKSTPERLVSFRLANIPLPPSPRYVAARRPNPPPPDPVPAGPERPFYQAGGATLVNRVQIGDRAARDGALQLGLAARQGDGWGPTRWLTVDLDRTGAARLEDLQPGSYRLLRLYRPAGTAAPPPGRWDNAELTVELTAGKETTPPLLRWSAIPDDDSPPARGR
jgi:hypothetical protein